MRCKSRWFASPLLALFLVIGPLGCSDAVQVIISIVAQELTPRDPEQAKKHTAEANRLLNNYRGNYEDMEAAANEIALALKNDPESAPAHAALARYYFMQERRRGQSADTEIKALAYRVLDKALELDPNLLEAHMLYAREQIKDRRFKEAEASIEKVKALKGDPTWILVTRAKLFRAQGRMADAVDVYREILDSGIKDKRVLVTCYEGLIAFHVSRFELGKADEYYRTVISLMPKDAWVKGNYAAFLLYARGNYDGAIEYARAALEIMEYGQARMTLAMALYTKWANLLIKEDKPEEAKAFFTQAQSIYPDLREALRTAKAYPALHVTAEAFETSGVMELG